MSLKMFLNVYTHICLNNTIPTFGEIRQENDKYFKDKPLKLHLCPDVHIVVIELKKQWYFLQLRQPSH